MNRTIRVSAAGDILIMKRLLPGYQDVLPIREFLMQGEVRMANLETNDIGRQLLRIGIFRRNMADGRCEVSGRYPALRF